MSSITVIARDVKDREITTTGWGVCIAVLAWNEVPNLLLYIDALANCLCRKRRLPFQQLSLLLHLELDEYECEGWSQNVPIFPLQFARLLPQRATSRQFYTWKFKVDRTTEHVTANTPVRSWLMHPSMTLIAFKGQCCDRTLYQTFFAHLNQF